MVVAESGSVVRLVPACRPSSRPPPKHTRGEVTGFSTASRLRLCDTIAQVDQDQVAAALFITLTYPADCAKAQQSKRHLDSFIKVLRRHCPEAATIWKLEYTQRGVPHYHLIVLGLHFWHRTAIANAWARIVGSDHPKHVEAGTRVERLANKKSATRYLSKYLSKEGNYPPDHKGRVWGHSGPLSLFYSVIRVAQLTREQFLAARRLLDRVRHSFKRTRRIRRWSDLTCKQRWFIDGRTLIRYLAYINAPTVSLDPRAPC